MKKTVLLPISSIIVIAGIILIVTLSSYKQNGQSSSLENMIVGKWVVTEAYEGDEFDYEYFEEDDESFMELHQSDGVIGQIWDIKNDYSYSFMVNNSPIYTGKWSIEGVDELMLSSDSFEVFDPYFDEETNEMVTVILHFDEEYDCTIKHIDKNKLTIIGVWVGTSWREEIHNGDTLSMMPPSYITSFKFSFVRLK